MEYVTTMDHWDAWQRAYQFGVLLIFPPEPLCHHINALRTRHDPQSQAICDAHISLTIPFPRPVSEQHWKELERLAADIQPFLIGYGPLRHYLPAPGVVFDIQPQATLHNLVRVLEQASV